MPQKLDLLYEGKAKRVYRTDDPKYYIVDYKDDATAGDGAKKGQILGKGEVNNRLSAILFPRLAVQGLPTHFAEQLSPREMLVRALKIIPVEVVVRNIVAGSLANRLGLPEGTPLKKTVLELYYKSDALHDPMINHYHVAALELASQEDLDLMQAYALQINDYLSKFLRQANLILVDFKLEFGIHENKLMLGDEISPDTCRLWDAESGEKLDKDRFRRDLGGVEAAYQEVLSRVEALIARR